jgi:D-lactate dehydrogenase
MKLDEPYAGLVDDLRSFIPANRIYTDPLRTLGWGTDASFYRMTPRVVVRSDGEEEVQRIVRTCAAHHTAFTFRAAGTSLSGQSLSDSVLIVAGKHWEKFELSDDHDTMTLGPGIVGGRVNQLLKPYGRVLPPDPASVNSAMIGGIVCNNASGMNCGTHANSDKMLRSARIILADGTLLDTGDEQSRKEFQSTHADFLKRICDLRDKVRANQKLVERIHYKYSIKNVTGLNIRPLVDYNDPFDIIAHSMVGSEGTLAFLASVTMRTLHDYPFKASAMVYFLTMKESCHAVVRLKQLKATDEDLAMSAEDLMVKSAEMLDYKSLSAVNDPVYLQYKKDVDAGRIEGVAPGDYHNLTAILTETKALTEEELHKQIEAISSALNEFHLYQPAEFTEDPKVYGKYWAIRSGIFPQVGGTRPQGTSCLIEDVAFHIEDLPEATVKLQKLIADHGYDDACIYGHAFEGNYHFILNQSFQSEAEVKRYSDMMHDVARLVIEDYGGSLKAEHGTGRNMAPFVKYEWGQEAYDVMVELKRIFDPEGLLNPGVIFNDDPNCFIEHLKLLPVLNYDMDHLPDGARYLAEAGAKESSTQEMIEGVKRANKCIECGFCEVNCMSCGLTLSSRMRIATQREVMWLRRPGATADEHRRADELQKQFRYLGNQTCAADGLCSTSCPMKINTGDVTHLQRQLIMDERPLEYKIGDVAARQLASCKGAIRLLLGVANMAHSILGSTAMSAICKALHRVGVPLWTPSMPRPYSAGHLKKMQQDGQQSAGQHHGTVVYIPSCLNQTMGLAKGAPVKNSLVDEMCQLFHKAGYDVIFPKNLQKLCCGQIWESKGMMDIADRKSAEMEKALWEASDHGRYPIVCDQSPCLHRMRKVMPRLQLYEPVEFTLRFLAPHLRFHQLHRSVAVHITCSMREMGLAPQVVELAKQCASDVLVPEGVGCCGFAGDRGFLHPEMNRYALRKLRPQIVSHHVERGYSNSRTCEIGLQTHSGVPYMGIAYLVNEATEPIED